MLLAVYRHICLVADTHVKLRYWLHIHTLVELCFYSYFIFSLSIILGTYVIKSCYIYIDTLFILPSILAQALILVTSIREVPHSNLGRDTDYPDRFMCFRSPSK
jgi:hypothetical protein